MEEKFDYFISHSSATKELARLLYYNAYSNNLHAWYDETFLTLGDPLVTEIERGIASSKAFVLLHSHQAMEKPWVPMEMELAVRKKESQRNFRLIAVKLDDAPLAEYWRQFLYLSWKPNDVPGSVIGLMEAVTGKKGLVQISASSVLSNIPSSIFVNESGTIAEHARNHVLYYLAHLKHLLVATVRTGHDDELRDTLHKALQTHVLASIPSLHGGRVPIGAGVWEVIHPVRMFIKPRVTIKGLPSAYSEEFLPESNEVFTRVRITRKENGEPVSHPVPFILELDARL